MITHLNHMTIQVRRKLAAMMFELTGIKPAMTMSLEYTDSHTFSNGHLVCMLIINDGYKVVGRSPGEIQGGLKYNGQSLQDAMNCVGELLDLEVVQVTQPSVPTNINDFIHLMTRERLVPEA